MHYCEIAVRSVSYMSCSDFILTIVKYKLGDVKEY